MILHFPKVGDVWRYQLTNRNPLDQKVISLDSGFTIRDRIGYFIFSNKSFYSWLIELKYNRLSK